MKWNLYKDILSITIQIKIWRLFLLCLLSVTRQLNIFPQYIYYILLTVELFFSFICIIKKKTDFIPVLNYLVIGFVLYDKPLTNFINGLILIYPFIDILAFRRKSLRYIWVLGGSYFACILSLMLLDGRFQGLYIIILLLLWPICFFICEQQKWDDFKECLNEKIDNYLGRRQINVHTHDLYRQIIRYWNRNNRDYKLEEISSYLWKNDVFMLIHSSLFKWDRIMNLSNKDITVLKSLKKIKQEEAIDSKTKKITCIVTRNLNNTCYAIEYKFKRYNHFSPFESLAVNNLLNSISGRLVNLTSFSYEIKRAIRKTEEDNLSKKYYVDNAIKTLHFIRNCLSPIATLIDFMKLSNKEQEELLKADKGLLKELIKSAQSDYKSIKNYADKMLDTTEYPFSNTEVQEISITQVFNELSDKVMGHLKTTITHNMDDTVPNVKVIANLSDLNLIFMDWIRNMEKYGTDFKVNWNLHEKELNITFINSSKEKKSNLQDIVSLLVDNSKETEHTRKKTHGINEMRTRAAHNNILIYASVDNSNALSLLNVKLQIPVRNE